MNIVKNIKSVGLNIGALLLLLILSLQSFAQDKKVDVSINTNGSSSTTWYAQPWVWIVGGLVFILLLVAIIRGGGRRD